MSDYFGTSGNDTFDGTSRRDVARGREGDDFLRGYDGNDRLFGSLGSDYLDGGNGNDRLSGGAGRDEIYGQAGDDVIFSGLDDDYVMGGSGNDTVKGGSGADFLLGDIGDDKVFGGAGDDALKGGEGIDRFDGGSGLDTVNLFELNGTHGAIVDLRIQRILDDGYGNREILKSIEGVGTTLFADTIYGSDGRNSLLVSVGDDVHGFSGRDVLRIATVKQAIIDGGEGRDTVDFQGFYRDIQNGGVVSFTADHGVSVDLSAKLVSDDGFGYSATLASIESVSGTELDDNILGSRGSNRLSGEGGDDHLAAGNGADIIVGGRGADVLEGGSDADVFVYDAEDYNPASDPLLSRDTIVDFEQGIDKVDVSSIDAMNSGSGAAFTFVGTAAFDGPGEVRYEYRGGNTIVSFEIDGNPSADFTIKLTGEVVLNATDFIL